MVVAGIVVCMLYLKDLRIDVQFRSVTVCVQVENLLGYQYTVDTFKQKYIAASSYISWTPQFYVQPQSIANRYYAKELEYC